MLNNKFQQYVQMEKNYYTYREDYGKICDLQGAASPAAMEMFEFLKVKMRELVELNEDILQARISYFECEESCNE